MRGERGERIPVTAVDEEGERDYQDSLVAAARGGTEDGRFFFCTFVGSLSDAGDLGCREHYRRKRERARGRGRMNASEEREEMMMNTPEL